ncbi:hypothetical protein SUDANB95_08011 (plasmid) [Actinosynnema sp. ALI-1.44]
MAASAKSANSMVDNTEMTVDGGGTTLGQALVRVPTLAAKIDLLFRVVRRDDGQEYAHKQVADSVGSTAAYISYLRSGARDNPGIKLLRKIATFFGVPVTYLAEEGGRPRVLSPREGEEGRECESTLADRLNNLFDIIRPSGGDQEYTNNEVADAVGCTPEDVAVLREGAVDMVSLTVVRCLAKFFGVPVAYLVGGADPQIAHVDEQLAVFRDLRRSGGLAMALQVMRLGSEDEQRGLAAIVEQVIALTTRPAEQPPPPS